MFDPSKDFVRQHERQLQREAQQRMDSSDRPWEHQKNPLLRRQGGHLRQVVIMLGVALVFAIIVALLFSAGPSPAAP